MKPIHSLVLSAPLAMLALPVWADDDTIIVTATRTAQSIDEALASVTVITSEQIEQRQAQSLEQLLRNEAGLHFVVNGGLGKQSSLLMRGTSENHTLLLVDGVRMGSATAGSLPIAHIPLHEIERIEIARGPRTSLYGSDAIGGVVHIFTKASADEGRSEAQIRYGSYNTSEYNAGMHWGTRDFNYSLQASALATDGFDSIDGNNTDADGYTRNTVNLGLNYRLNNKGKISVSSMQASGMNEYDNVYAASNTDLYTNTYKLAANSVKFDLQFSETWQSRLNLSNSIDGYIDYINGTDNGRFNTERNQLTWQNDLSLSARTLTTVGLDYLNETVSSNTTTYTDTQRNNTALFAQNQWKWKQSDLLIALRSDLSDSYGTNTTGNLSYGLEHHGLRSFFALGTAFHAPTFNDLYWPSVGNPDLKPEQSQNIEIGTGAKGAITSWSLNIYQNNVTNLIAWAPVDPLDPAGPWQPSNINSASIQGIEWLLDATFGNWTAGFGIDLLEARDASTKTLLPRRPQQMVKFSLDGRLFGTDVGAHIKHVGEHFDDVFNTTTISAYTLVDLTLNKAIGKRWLVNARIDNALDVDYETSAGYNNPRRSYSIGVKYELDR
ncbi:MAG: TonB-dependent receptor [Gammaproteobacteria bacterium]|nr:TonB-dependent receptor [Gammaproteobacteria bacterium]